MKVDRAAARRLALFGAAAPLVYGAAAIALASPELRGPPDLGAIAVTIDLVLLVPLLFHLLLVRSGRVPRAFLMPVAVASLAGAAWMLPTDRRQFLDLLHQLLVPAELGLIGYAAMRLRREVLRERARPVTPGGPDLLERLQAILGALVPGPVARVMSHEALVLGYAVAGWWGEPDVSRGDSAFTWHRRGGFLGLLGAAALITVVETGVLHLLVASWNPTAAWILTGLGIYGLVWILGMIHAVRLRPIRVFAGGLHLRVGLLWSARVPIEAVRGLRPGGRGTVRSSPERLDVSPGSTRFHVLELTRAAEVEGPYGFTRRGIRSFTVAPDDPEGFLRALRAAGASIEAPG